MEYLGVTTFFIIMTGIFFAYSFSAFSENKNLAFGQDSVAKIANNANLVASMGDGSSIYFAAEFPDDSKTLSAYNKYILLSYGSGSGATKVYAYSRANITPFAVPVNSGRRTMNATFTDGNVVIG